MSNDINIKTLEFMRNLKAGAAVAYELVMLKGNGQIDIVSHGSAADQALIMLCLDNHIKKQMFSKAEIQQDIN